jgi:hypothetical protein
MTIIKKPLRRAFYLGTLFLGIVLPLVGKIVVGNRQDFSRQSDRAKNFFSIPEKYVGVPDVQADTVGSVGCTDGCDGCTSGTTGDCTAVDGSVCT